MPHKGISFGTLVRPSGNGWDTSAVSGLPASRLAGNPPNLIIRAFHQAGAVISLRQFTNNAMNHHHGIQTTERFGVGTDPDGDGFENEMTQADVTAATIFQATMAERPSLWPTMTMMRSIARGKPTRPRTSSNFRIRR